MFYIQACTIPRAALIDSPFGSSIFLPLMQFSIYTNYSDAPQSFALIIAQQSVSKGVWAQYGENCLRFHVYTFFWKFSVFWLH